MNDVKFPKLEIFQIFIKSIIVFADVQPFMRKIKICLKFDKIVTD